MMRFLCCLLNISIISVVYAYNGNLYPQRPAFFASLTQRLLQLHTGGEKVKFDKVWTNIHSCYNPQSGIFTAPIGGLYYFSSTIMSADGERLAMALNRNNDMLVKGLAIRVNGATNTMTAIVELKMGDKVFVSHRHGHTETMIGGYHTNFSGYMIQ